MCVFSGEAPTKPNQAEMTETYLQTPYVEETLNVKAINVMFVAQCCQRPLCDDIISKGITYYIVYFTHLLSSRAVTDILNNLKGLVNIE